VAQRIDDPQPHRIGEDAQQVDARITFHGSA
jgi:hypothetical protein